MKMTTIVLAVGLLVSSVSCAVPLGTNAHVTVWYERTYTVKADGSKVQKVKSIPWSADLTLLRAIASAGGYSNPPVHHVYLVRDGESSEIDVRAIESKKAPDPVMRPGDVIELKAEQNKTHETIGAKVAPQSQR